MITKKYKVEAVKEMVQKLCPNVEIIPFPKDVKDPEFTKEFFGGFDIIYNVVDSMEARTYISKKAIEANRPLFDGGSERVYG